MIIKMYIIESGAVVSCACTIYFVGGWRILHRCLKILWKTFIIGLDCCSLHLFVKLCLQDNRVKHSISFKLLTHDKKRKKSSLKFKMPKCTNLSFNSTARSVQNLLGYVTRPEQVWDSILLMIPECTNWGITHLTQTLISIFLVQYVVVVEAETPSAVCLWWFVYISKILSSIVTAHQTFHSTFRQRLEWPQIWPVLTVLGYFLFVLWPILLHRLFRSRLLVVCWF